MSTKQTEVVNKVKALEFLEKQMSIAIRNATDEYIDTIGFEDPMDGTDFDNDVIKVIDSVKKDITFRISNLKEKHT